MAETEFKEVSIDTLPMAEYKEARSKGLLTIPEKVVEEVEDTEDGEEVKGEAKTEKPKSNGGFQRRIDRLIKEKSSAEERADAAEKKAAELEAKAGTKQEATKASDEPKREDFQTDQEYIKAQARWEVREELKQQKIKEEREAEDAKTQSVFKSYNERLAEARAKIEDFDEVVGASDAPLPQSVILTIIEMDNGPEVAYYLGKNPDVREALMEMRPLKAIGVAWEISKELAGEEKQEKKPVEEKEEETTKIVTKAPIPIKPVGGSNTKSSVPLGEMNLSEYKKARAAGRVS